MQSETFAVEWLHAMISSGRPKSLFAAMQTIGFLMLSIFPLRAIVDANSQANTNAPADGVPWANMGNVNGASGIYVGAGWVLTAWHVGANDILLNGAFYHYDGTVNRLTNSNGTGTDLILFHLSTLPPLPRLTLASRTPSPSSVVDFVGFGHISGSTQTLINGAPGFYWSTGGFKSWGNNRVNVGGVTTINAGAGDVVAFNTDFSAPGLGQTSDEAQAAAGDSGGGVFQQGGSTWQLVGVIDTIDVSPTQPGDTAVYGNLTYAADMATYGPQVTAILASTLPALTISRAGTNVQVCWPDTGIAYTLEATASFTPPAWNGITPAPTLTLTNGQYCALLPATNSSRFFRLKH